MSKKKKRKFKKILAFVLVIVILIFLIILYNEKVEKEIIEMTEAEQVNVTTYFVYGTHFNIIGEINGIETKNIKKINFSLIDKSKNVIEYDAIYTVQEEIVKVQTSDLINEGIYLEDIDKGKYFLFLKITYSNEDVKYYSMKNDTSYDDIEYYTITNNNSNKKIKISFNSFNSVQYIKINVDKIKLPTNVYDVSIDPGHGGSDPGAKTGTYKESEIVMEYSNELKNALEELGLKVILTRDGTEDTSENSPFNYYSVYDYDGRVNVVGRSKVKYNLSIHVNSLTTSTVSGTEIYAPSNASLNFAQLLADNILKIVNTTYSTRDIDKVSDGVYVRTFTEEEIEEDEKSAIENGYNPYYKTTSTPSLYMIREVGGIATGAYVDGRNKEFGTNLYYNSNIGVESYLIELGYISNKTDLNNLLNNQSGYIEAIAISVREYIINE